MSNKLLKPKLIHLSPEVIKAISIQAINEGKTFKAYTQEVLIKKAAIK